MTSDEFLKELKRLIATHPKRPSQVLNSENSEFGSNIYYSKNLYNCFDCSRSTDLTHSTDSHDCVNSSDLDFCYESELCYECDDIHHCFNCSYLEYCGTMTDSDFCYDSSGCHDVFGCVHLDNKSFCIFNRQLTEDEYREKVKYLKTLPAQKIIDEVNKIKSTHPVTQTRSLHNENSDYGNYVFYSKNCYMCFDTAKNEDCGYIHDSSNHKNSYDVSQSGESELSYEVIDSGNIFNSDFIMFSKLCNDSSYLFDCSNVKNSIGCVRLDHKEYCILNRQFSQEEYEKIAAPLLSGLRSKYIGWDDLIY